MKKKLLIAFSVVLSVLVVAILVVGIVFYAVPPTLNVNAIVGVKWMQRYSDEETDKYLDFLQKNGVDEIYYSVTEFNNNIDTGSLANNDITRGFVQKVRERGMKVYAYWDKIAWLTNQSAFETVYNSYKSYRSAYSDYDFDGLHINVLPTSMTKWSSSKRSCLNDYLDDFVFYICDMCHKDNIKVDFEMLSDIDLKGASANVIDDNNYVFQFNGTQKSASEWIIDSADRVFVVNGSNSHKVIRDVSSVEFEYAKQQDKCIFYNFETRDLTDESLEGNENDGTTYFVDSKRKLYNDMKKAGKGLNQDFGYSISDVESWYKLKNN